jgi:hypothetical protein
MRPGAAWLRDILAAKQVSTKRLRAGMLIASRSAAPVTAGPLPFSATLLDVRHAERGKDDDGYGEAAPAGP